MKRFMTIMLALSFLTVTVTTAFAQDTTKKKTSSKKGKKKSGKKTPDTPKKDGGS
jgi:hypothetical protein